MSLPGVLNIALENLNQAVQYVVPSSTLTKEWAKILGLKFKLRVGFCWSGRRDTWINRHKGMPFEKIVKLISDNPTYEWINLQADTTDSESQILESIGVSQYPGSIRSFADTAALIQNLDVVISVDTAIAHLSGAIGRPTWIMLSQYAVDWRWLLDRDSNPWYPTARLFRQPKMGDWDSVTAKIHQYLSWFKV
jgi:ADP-heptose:LPS heptosyltransferase